MAAGAGVGFGAPLNYNGKRNDKKMNKKEQRLRKQIKIVFQNFLTKKQKNTTHRQLIEEHK